MFLPSVMAALQSPKLSVRVRVSWGMPNAGRQVMGPPAAFQAEDRGVRLSLPAPVFYRVYYEKNQYRRSKVFYSIAIS